MSGNTVDTVYADVRGFDSGAKINGRKRLVAVAAEGVLLPAVNIGDRHSAGILIITLVNICSQLQLDLGRRRLPAQSVHHWNLANLAANPADTAEVVSAGTGPAAGPGASQKDHPVGRRRRTVNPAPHQRIRAGPSRSKTVCRMSTKEHSAAMVTDIAAPPGEAMR
ncbi:hypothetical protein ACFPIJ_55850 [Dactylosporangium cerinum]|uniref:Transposase n=1 Tax=Dactylosporangium cerinum TaxID=1434730 RepID=A0ABV9WFB7_9ACTN